MDGLIIKKKWLDLILNGEKTIEIRSTLTSKRGNIALIESGSGEIKGRAYLSTCFKYTSNFHFARGFSKHKVSTSPYKNPCGWKFVFVGKLITPIPYTHPQGAVIWVKDVL